MSIIIYILHICDAQPMHLSHKLLYLTLTFHKDSFLLMMVSNMVDYKGIIWSTLNPDSK